MGLAALFLFLWLTGATLLEDTLDPKVNIHFYCIGLTADNELKPVGTGEAENKYFVGLPNRDFIPEVSRLSV